MPRYQRAPTRRLVLFVLVGLTAGLLAGATAHASKSGKGAGHDGTSYAVYEVVLVRAGSGGASSTDFLTVTGTNEGGTLGYTGNKNEGYLYHDAFGPQDTFLPEEVWRTPTGGIMQLHVSCSDVFAGGYGSKSDPAAGAEWLVNTIHIDKYRDGVWYTDCDVTGLGLPVPPPPEEPPNEEPPPPPPPT